MALLLLLPLLLLPLLLLLLPLEVFASVPVCSAMTLALGVVCSEGEGAKSSMQMGQDSE